MDKLKLAVAVFALVGTLAGCGRAPSGSETAEVRIPRGAGGAGFLPLLVMEKYQLIEKQAAAAGLPHLRVRWIDLGGPSVVNDALLSGSADIIAAGPPAFLTLWDRTLDSAKVKGIAAMSSLPMYLDTRAEHLKSLDDLKEGDKIAVTALKVSIPALIMQIYASQKYGLAEAARFDKYTVTMTHPDGLIALLAGSGGVDAHFTSPPFHQRERKDPRVRTILTSDEVMGGPATFTMISASSAFRERNPKVSAAVLAALEEANRMIAADNAMAAKLLIDSSGGAGFTLEEMTAILKDPAIRFTTTPENVTKYAEFMYRTGSIKHRPTSWKDLFFPEIQNSPGS
jgi:NitT/TauT family transport system substrate-binding protein